MKRKFKIANKNVKLKNLKGDYLYPYTENIPTASETVAGKVKLDNTPTADSKNAITSGAVHTALAGKASLVSPAFTEKPTVPTPAVSDNSTLIINTQFIADKFKVVSARPAEPDPNTFYFVKE